MYPSQNLKNQIILFNCIRANSLIKLCTCIAPKYKNCFKKVKGFSPMLIESFFKINLHLLLLNTGIEYVLLYILITSLLCSLQELVKFLRKGIFVHKFISNLCL